MNIAALLEKSAIQHGDRPALTVHDQIHASYRTFSRRVRAMAFSLRHRLELKTGDRVAIAMSNRPEFYETFLVCNLACRIDRSPDQRKIASQGIRIHPL